MYTRRVTEGAEQAATLERRKRAAIIVLADAVEDDVEPARPGPRAAPFSRSVLSSRPEEFHLRALPAADLANRPKTGGCPSATANAFVRPGAVGWPFPILNRDTLYFSLNAAAHYIRSQKRRVPGHFRAVGCIVVGRSNVIWRQIPSCPTDPDVIVVV